MLGRYAPPSVLVNQDFEMQQFRGRTSPFLETPGGQPTTNILRMAKEGLFMELRSALTEAKATNGAGRARRPARRRTAATTSSSRCASCRSTSPQQPRLLPAGAVRIEGLAGVVGGRARATTSLRRHAPTATRRWLRQELASTKQYLQSIVDQQEAATQELRAAHEEVLSSNEELQSTNEELETTKEELQSANEELTTVNEQFQSRNRELDALTDDLSNFISSADLPMVTVGRDLRIRRLTPAAQKAFNLLPTDVGRSIEHIKFSLAVDGIGAIDRAGDRHRCSRGSARSATATAAGGCCACCRSAPPTIASTARPSWRSTST